MGRINEGAEHCVSEGHRVSHRHQSAESSIFQNLAWSMGTIGADHRTATCHCFDQDSGKGLVSGGQNEQIGPRKIGMRILDETWKVDVFGDTKFVRQRPKFLLQRSLSEHYQPGWAADEKP